MVLPESASFGDIKVASVEMVEGFFGEYWFEGTLVGDLLLGFGWDGSGFAQGVEALFGVGFGLGGVLAVGVLFGGVFGFC